MKWIKCTDETLPPSGYYFIKIGPLQDKACWRSAKIIERYNELKSEEGLVEIYYLDESPVIEQIKGYVLWGANYAKTFHGFPSQREIEEQFPAASLQSPSLPEQGEKTIDEELRELGYDPEKVEQRASALIRTLTENVELKKQLEKEQQDHYYTRCAWDQTCIERDKFKAASIQSPEHKGGELYSKATLKQACEDAMSAADKDGMLLFDNWWKRNKENYDPQPLYSKEAVEFGSGAIRMWEGKIVCGKSTVDGSYVKGIYKRDAGANYIDGIPVHSWSIGRIPEKDIVQPPRGPNTECS